ncbi:hypothetical protein C8R45DRAFT_1097476 [Mycena sanguinolenta]|nr:hypothetical protein C8R45DRAFT_1097476 [Mycena sanguinolenta]
MTTVTLKSSNPPPNPGIIACTRRRQLQRKYALERYYTNHAEVLREKARERMQKVRLAQKEQDKSGGQSQSRAHADSLYREMRRQRQYIEKFGKDSFRDFYLPLLGFFGSGNLSGVTIVDETCKNRSRKFRLAITEEHKEAKKKFEQGRRVKLKRGHVAAASLRLTITFDALCSPFVLLFVQLFSGLKVFRSPILRSPFLVPFFPWLSFETPICTPKFYASHNFDGYRTHDIQKQRYYWIVLDGYKIGIYSLRSAAESYLPAEGKFSIIRCETITEAGFCWIDWCKQKHILSCDPVKREQTRLEVAKRRDAKPMPDSEDDAPLPGLSAPPKRRIDVLDGPGPKPDRGHLMNPVIFPLDEKAARKLGLKADGSQLGHGESPGFKQEGPSRIKMASPSLRRRRVRESPSPSSEPKLPLFRDDDDDLAPVSKPSTSLPPVHNGDTFLSSSVTSASSLSASTTSAASRPIQSRSFLESASTARSPALGSNAPRSKAPPKPSKFQPSISALSQVEERRSTESAGRSIHGPHPAVPSQPQTVSTSRHIPLVAPSRAQTASRSRRAPPASTSRRAPLTGPFFFNPDKQTIYCDLCISYCSRLFVPALTLNFVNGDAALDRMRRKDELVVVHTAGAMLAVIQAGGVLSRKKIKEEDIVEISDESEEEMKREVKEEDEVVELLDDSDIEMS